MAASSKISIDLPAYAFGPAFCRDRNDYIKLVFGTVRALTDNSIDERLLINTIKTICHDYLALVLAGNISPYEAEVSEEVVREFRDFMDEVNVALMQSGFPMKEGENGRMILDEDKIKEDLKKKNQGGIWTD